MSSFIKEDAVFQKENKINMQSSYETAEIHQQHFMADDSFPSTATATAPPAPFSLSNSFSHNKQNHLLHHYHHPHHQYQQQQQQQHITQQLFQHPHHFQAFQQQQQQRRLHHDLCLGHETEVIETVGNCGMQTLPFFTVKLGLNENNGNIRGVSNDEEEKEDECLVRGNEKHNIPEGRPNSLVMPHSWPPQEDSAIKEPLWKPLSTELFIRDYKWRNEGEEEEAPDHGMRNSKYSLKFSEQVNGNLNHQGKGILLEKKYRHFGELEAIYGPTRMGEETNQTGTGSALTAENSPPNATHLLPMSFDHPQCLNFTATGSCNAALFGGFNGSETSIGEEASILKKSSQKRKRKRKMRDKLGSMALFFERLVKQLMDHQESLHEKFLGLIGKMDQERMKREELWRREEAEKYNCEAIARAHEQALASCREAAIVSCLEKITGQSINLPSRETQLQLENVIPEEPIKELRHIDAQNINSLNTNYTNNRWPKAEVEALIRVRRSLELKFQEPGLKGPLWEEISNSMASMGYIRSAKRCKEKWENINKYFRKTKESAKKRSQVSKTCPYFEQLDQLYYSRPLIIPASSSIANDVVGVQIRGNNSELLEAIINARNDLGITPNNPSTENFKVVEMGHLNKLDFDGINIDEEGELQQGCHEKQKEFHDEDSKDNEEEEEEEEEDDEEDEEEGGVGGD